MNAKIAVFAICIKAIIYLLLYHNCTFNKEIRISLTSKFVFCLFKSIKSKAYLEPS